MKWEMNSDLAWVSLYKFHVAVIKHQENQDSPRSDLLPPLMRSSPYQHGQGVAKLRNKFPIKLQTNCAIPFTTQLVSFRRKIQKSGVTIFIYFCLVSRSPRLLWETPPQNGACGFPALRSRLNVRLSPGLMWEKGILVVEQLDSSRDLVASWIFPRSISSFLLAYWTNWREFFCSHE